MPNLRRPGTYIEEVLNPIASPTESSTSTAAFLGEHFRGPTTATLLRSWSDFVKHFGGFPPSGSPVTDFPYGVYVYFANGGRETWAARILGDDAVKSTATLVDRAGTPLDTLQIDAVSEGEWGDLISYTIVTRDADTGRFDLVVLYDGKQVERFDDLSMAEADQRYVEKVINSPTGGSLYITVTDLDSATASPDDMPAAVTAQALADGANGDAATTSQRTSAVSAGTSPLDTVEGLVNVNMPGETDDGVIGALLTYATARGEMMVAIDTEPDLSAADAVSAATGLSAVSPGVVYWPHLIASDPTGSSSTVTRRMPPGAFALGLWAATDARRGVFKAPAGYAARLSGVYALERKLTGDDLDILNEGHVNAIRQIPGQGFVVMGARTLATGKADMYINVRRTLNYIRYNLMRSTEFALFENNDQQLWRQITNVAERFLGGLWSAGGLRGATPDQAFYVQCDGELNTEQTISEGKVIFEVGVALQYPAEFIVIRIGQWEGGQSVVEAA